MQQGRRELFTYATANRRGDTEAMAASASLPAAPPHCRPRWRCQARKRQQLVRRAALHAYRSVPPRQPERGSRSWAETMGCVPSARQGHGDPGVDQWQSLAAAWVHDVPPRHLLAIPGDRDVSEEGLLDAAAVVVFARRTVAGLPTAVVLPGAGGARGHAWSAIPRPT